jgi:hypothetical protein
MTEAAGNPPQRQPASERKRSKIMANTLSKNLTRVCDEILAWRGERERLLSGLQLETRERRRAVFRMLARFANELAEIARRRRDVRMVFLPGLRRTAFRFQQEIRLRQSRPAATHAHCGEQPRSKTDAAEPCRGTTSASTTTDGKRQRRGVRRQHRP